MSSLESRESVVTMQHFLVYNLYKIASRLTSSKTLGPKMYRVKSS